MAILRYKDENDNWQPLTYLKVKGFNDHTGAYKVESVAEMNAITDMEDGDYCVIETPIVPNTYTPVEYIQSSGTQYIDTGFKTNSNLSVNIYASLVEWVSETALFGSSKLSGGSTSERYFNLYYTNEGIRRVYFYTASSGYDFYNLPSGFDPTSKHKYSTNKNKFYVDDNLWVTGNSSQFTSTLNFYLFGYNKTGSFTGGSKAKIYSAEILNNGVRVRNLIPCYRNSDSVIGMYDTVNDVFYTNSGTGTFTKGSNVDNFYYDVYRYNGTSWVQA